MGWEPSLRFHTNGQWFFRHAKRDHYLGKDKAAAEVAFRAYFAALQGARAAGASKAQAASLAPDVGSRRKNRAPSARTSSLPPTGAKVPTVRDAADQLRLWSAKRRIARSAKQEEYRLAGFLAAFGERPIDSLSLAELSQWASQLRREDGKEYSPTSFNHRVQAVRRLLTWAYDAGILERPYRLAMLAPVPLPSPRQKAMKPGRIRAVVSSLYGLNPSLGRMYLLALWAALRPSEVGRVLRRDWSREDQDGSALPEGCYRLQVSKTRRRIVILTPEAEALLAQIEPQYCGAHESQLNHAVQRARQWIKDLPPIHPMRHSAATAMIDAGNRLNGSWTWTSTTFGRVSLRRV